MFIAYWVKKLVSILVTYLSMIIKNIKIVFILTLALSNFIMALNLIILMLATHNFALFLDRLLYIYYLI